MTTRSVIFLLLLLCGANADYSFSEDIVLKSGKTYKNIDVFKQEADRLLITHPGGMAIIYLKDCPKDIQRKYNYNPTSVDAVISEREKKAQSAQEQLQRDQKIQVEKWNKEQAAKEQQAAKERQKAEQQKAAAAQLENEGLVKAQKPMVACFTPAGGRMIRYDASAMKRIIDCRKAAISVQAQGGTQSYFIDNSDTMNTLRLFMRLNYGEKGTTVAHRYVSCEFLTGLRFDGEISNELGNMLARQHSQEMQQREAQQRTEEQIRSLESKISSLQY
ncbi:MAG: hypothetical protein Q7J98_13405 [Kiritimatiellia bacterium]|nr:hypothetical protein [Kiritimatiellia bacterium]